MLFTLQGILIPLIFALISAILLHPIVNFLERKKINRLIAICITLTFITIIILGLFSLLYSQLSSFVKFWPILVERFTTILNQSITNASSYFNIKPLLIQEWITTIKNEFIATSSSYIGNTFMSIGNIIISIFLVPVYVLIILYYHPLLIDFVHKIFRDKEKKEVIEMISQIKTVIQRYLVGLMLEAILVSILNIVALLILGVQYAFILGIIGGILNSIPYIGGIIAIALPIIVVLATNTSVWSVLYIIIAYSIIQLIDNNYIVPKIVASRVKINALFSIIVVIAGNALWGVAGMFLSIPLLAIIKLIFDHITPLKPWGFLLGDSMPTSLQKHPINVNNKKL